jgi:hypothetical protein
VTPRPASSLIPGVGLAYQEPTSWQKLWCSCSPALQHLLALRPELLQPLDSSLGNGSSSGNGDSMGVSVQGLHLQQGQGIGGVASRSRSRSRSRGLTCSAAAAALQNQLQPVAAGAAAVVSLLEPLLQLLSALAALGSQGVAIAALPAAGTGLGAGPSAAGATVAAVAAGLQVLQGLLQHDENSLEVAVMMLGLHFMPGVLGPGQQQQQKPEQQQQVGPVSTSLLGSGVTNKHISSADLGASKFVGSDRQGAGQRSWSSADAAAAVALQMRSSSAVAAIDSSRAKLQQQQQQRGWVSICNSTSSMGPSALLPSATTQGISGGALSWEGGFLALLQRLGSIHPDLLPEVGCVLAVLSTQLPTTLQQLLLPVLSSGLLGQLLSHGSPTAKSSGLLVLQAALGCPKVAAAVATAAAAKPKESDQQQQAPAATEAVAGEGVCESGSSRVGSSMRGRGPEPSAAAGGTNVQAIPNGGPVDLKNFVLEPTLAAELINSWLDCLAWHEDPAAAADGLNPEAGCSSSSSTSHELSSLSCWGKWEVQRRAVAAAAATLQLCHLQLLLLLLGEELTCGEGLAQRLVGLINGASAAGSVDICSPVLPCVLTGCPCCSQGASPLEDGAAAAKSGQVFVRQGGAAMQATGGRAATAGGAGVQVGRGTSVPQQLQMQQHGSKCCGLQEFQQRVQLVHEAMLLLRTLVASPAPVGKHGV